MFGQIEGNSNVKIKHEPIVKNQVRIQMFTQADDKVRQKEFCLLSWSINVAI